MRTILLAGFHPLSLDWAKEQPPEVEIWVPNEGNQFVPRVDRVFQMHPRRWRENERMLRNGNALPLHLDHNCFGRGEKHVEYLRTCGVPVYGQRVWSDIPTSVAYPFHEITERFGVPFPPSYRKRLYVTSTFGYMVALACWEHVQAGPEVWVTSGTTYGTQEATVRWPVSQHIAEIRIAGVELYDGREGRWEKPNLLYWLGIAQGLGIKIGLPPQGTSFLNAPLYAVEGPYQGGVDGDDMPGAVAVEDVALFNNPNTGHFDLVPAERPQLNRPHFYRRAMGVLMKAIEDRGGAIDLDDWDNPVIWPDEKGESREPCVG